MSALATVASILVLTAAMPAFAQDFRVGSLNIGHPWSRATPGGATTGAGYLTITNTGPEPDRLLAGSVEVASGFELHKTSVAEGVASMRPLEGGLEIRSGESVELKPGGTHIMLVNLKGPLEAGMRFSGTLVFEKAGAAQVRFEVRQVGSSGPRHDEHGAAHTGAGKSQ